MTEHTSDPVAPEPGQPSAAGGQELADPVRTGVEEVDAVLDSVADLSETPLDDHVAVFEQAHERLRGALDGRADG